MLFIFVLALAAVAFVAAMRFFPEKKWLVLLVSLVVFAGVFFSVREAGESANDADDSARRATQQTLVAEWHASYQPFIDEIDRNWKQYHRILYDFEEDIISIETAYLRLTALSDESAATAAAIEKMTPPDGLDEENRALVAAVIDKTHAYAARQNFTISATAKAADEERLSDHQQEYESMRLRDVMKSESPAGLFTAKEIARLRENVAER